MRTAPRAGTQVLLYVVGPAWWARRWRIVIGEYGHYEEFINGKRRRRFKGWIYTGMRASKHHKPTHWMALPEGPK